MDAVHGSPRVAPRRHSQSRLAFFRMVERAAALCGGRAFYRHRHLAHGRFRIRVEDVEVRGLASALDGFAIAHLSDLHAGSFLGPGDLCDVVAAVGALDPDVVAITGDWITHHWTDVLRVRSDCADLHARHGVFAVFGNHDYKDRLEGRIVAGIGAAGVRFLRNESVRVVVGTGAVALVGLEDLEEARAVDLALARSGLRTGDVEIVLCHNPSGARAIARPGCAAILSGHTHGTQLDLPFLRRLGPRHPGLRIALGDTQLVVNRGLGVVGFPLRIGSPAEVVLVRLRPVAQEGPACTEASR